MQFAIVEEVEERIDINIMSNSFKLHNFAQRSITFIGYVIFLFVPNYLLRGIHQNLGTSEVIMPRAKLVAKAKMIFVVSGMKIES